MFVFSIVPYALFGYSGPQTNSQLGQAEQALMNLESALSNIILGTSVESGYQSTYQTVEGNLSITDIENQMAQRRSEILGLIGTATPVERQASIMRTEQINAHSIATSVRTRDLARLSYAIENGIGLNYVVSGVDNTDLNSVSEALEQTLNYSQLLNQQGSFWREVTRRHLEQIQQTSTSKDVNNYDREAKLATYSGFERIIGVSDLLNSVLSVNAANGTQPPQDKVEKMKKDIFYEQHLFLKNLSESKSKPWFDDIVAEALTKVNELTKELKKVKETIQQLDEKISAAESANHPGIERLRTQQEGFNNLKISLEDQISFMREVISGSSN